MARPKTPNEILKNRGSEYAVKDSDMQGFAPLEDPDKPTDLSDYASECWDKIIRMLGGMDVLSSVDHNVLKRYCEMWGLWHHCKNVVLDEGPIYDKPHHSGGVVPTTRPEVDLMNTLNRDMQKIESLFGLNPSSRSALRVGTKKQSEESVSDEEDPEQFWKDSGSMAGPIPFNS